MTASIPLCSVVDVSAGQPAPRPHEFGEEGYPFIRAGSLPLLLDGGTLDGCERVPDIVAQSRRLRLYPRGTVLFAKSGMSATKGHVYQLPDCAYVVSHLAALIPTCRCDPSYLVHWLRRNPPSRLIRDLAYPSIRISDIQALEVPTISLEEQHHIADVLDKADDIRRKGEYAVALVEGLLRSVFLEMFGDPVPNPKGWPTARLAELGHVQGGLQVSQRRNTHSMQKPYLRVANVFRDRLDLAEIKVIGLTQLEHQRVRLSRGDVLIVEGHGNPGEIGRTAVWDGSVEDCVHQNHLIRFRPDSTTVLGEYVSRLLNSCGGRRQLVAAGRTTSGLNTISTAKVKDVVVPVPPIELQRAFVATVRKHESLLRRLEAGRIETDKLCAAASQRAFRGEL